MRVIGGPFDGRDWPDGPYDLMDAPGYDDAGLQWVHHYKRQGGAWMWGWAETRECLMDAGHDGKCDYVTWRTTIYEPVSL